MANDRLYLACRTCLQAVVIWKHFPSGGYAPEETEGSDVGRVARFIAAHLEQHGNQHAMRFLPMAPFIVATESTPLDITLWNEQG